MIPLLLMLQDTPAAIPVRLDLRNWHSVETTDAGKRACTFSLSPNFYGIVVRYTGTSEDFEVSFDSPGVHVLPTGIPIPLKIAINSDVQMVKGYRVDRRLIFPLKRAAIDTSLAKRGMIRILLSDPSIPDTLIARYRLRGTDYEGAAARFKGCSDNLRAQNNSVALASGR